MAIRVGYWENNKVVEYKTKENNMYSEGPFVMVNASGWRIEVEYKGQHCPALPDSSIYAFLKDKGLTSDKTDDEALCACLVDYLNAKVKDGTLVLDPKHKVTYVWELHEINLEMEKYYDKRSKSIRNSVSY